MQLEDVMTHLRSSTDPKTQKAYEYLDAIFKSPYFPSYIALKGQMERWNKEILEKNVPIVIESTVHTDDEGNKVTTTPSSEAFKNVHSYFKEMTDYVKSLEALRAKILPAELKKVDKPQSTEDLLEKSLK